MIRGDQIKLQSPVQSLLQSYNSEFSHCLVVNSYTEQLLPRMVLVPAFAASGVLRLRALSEEHPREEIIVAMDPG
jgi:hypothetical protein